MFNSIHYAQDYPGLSAEEVLSLRQIHGKNTLNLKARSGFVSALTDIVRDPMLILLFLACIIYLVLRQWSEGIMMGVAIFLVYLIGLYQKKRSSKALDALKTFTSSKVTAIRSDQEELIDAEDLVPGDIILLNEGESIPADAIVIKQNDLSVNEAVITGESYPVEKEVNSMNNLLFQGATINSGRCLAQITTIGANTKLGQIGKSIQQEFTSKTLLQNKVIKVVRQLAFGGVAALLLVMWFHYSRSSDLAASIILGLTIAMAAIPEEIPVAFTSFMALAAYELTKMGIITRNPQVIEDMGQVSVLCMDKTGTLTENKIKVDAIYDFNFDEVIYEEEEFAKTNVLRFAVMASELAPFDALEKAICECYKLHEHQTNPGEIIHEYPLEGRPPMMTHVYTVNSEIIAAGKGAPERILKVCRLDHTAVLKVNERIDFFTSRGYKVLGVASARHTASTYPERQDDFEWKFDGLLALNDPSRPEAADFIQKLQTSDIQALLITGDHPATTIAIADKIGLTQKHKYRTGEEIMAMSTEAIYKATTETNLFVRMFPEAKLKLITALKEMGKVVAMIGDGVNDGGALKAAHIGIAMGKKGTEVAKLAADLVLTKDDLGKVIEAIHYGKKVLSNLKKAIRYIIVIHMPILLIASVPMVFSWKYPVLFTPIHIIFLELIMGPTCSIFFEREPLEQDNRMVRKSAVTGRLFSNEEIVITIIQGLSLAAGLLLIYYFYSMHSSVEVTRTIVFMSLLISNLLLTFVNRSFTRTIARTFKYKNKLVPYVLVSSLLFIVMIYSIPFFSHLFGLSTLTPLQFIICTATSLISVGWFEIYKVVRGHTSGPKYQN